MGERVQKFSLGGEASTIADTAKVQSKMKRINGALDIKSVQFEAQIAMTDAEDHVIVDLYRVRTTTATKIYTYTFAADSVAYTAVSLAAVSAAYAKLQDGDRLFAVITNETGSAVAPLNWAVHVECELGLAPATTSYPV